MKIYVYPTWTPSRDKSGNLYLKYFHEAFEKNSNFQLINRFWKLAVGSIFFNLDADIFIIQWIDLIPGKRYGRIQFVLFLLSISICKLLHKKVIWLLHNKQAHNGKSKLVDYGMKFMAKKADKVIVHSKEGIAFFDNKYPKFAGKCSYIPHPVYTQDIYHSSQNIKYDYIIWGSIDKRKNILNFLTTIKRIDFFKKKQILICGACRDSEYDNRIKSELTPNITYINQFLSDEELQKYIGESRCILFTYNGESMLSSGALIYSLNYCKPIIGPNVGSFADEKDIVSVYDDFNDIENIKMRDNSNACKEYLDINTWEKFPDEILKLIK